MYGFKVGDAAPASLGSYVLLDDTVYLVNTAYVSIFEKTLTDYISLTVAEKLGDGEVLDSIQLTRNGETISLTYVPEEVVETQQDGQTVTETIPAYYAMNNPVPAALSYSKVTGWSTLMAGFSADAIAAVAPDAAQIKAYGLDQPTYKLSYTTTAGNAVTLYAAEADGGVCYLMREGVNLVYVTTSSALGWLNVTPEILLSTLFPGVQAADVQAVSLVSSTGASYELAAADGAYTNNGQQITADEFTAVVEGVFAIAPTYTDAVSETQLKPVLTIIISYTDGASALLRLIPTGSGALYAFLDDDPSQYTCDESVVQSLLALCKQAGGV